MRNFSEQTQIVVSKDQVSTNVGGEAAVLNLKNGVYYGLDTVGARIWTIIQQPRTFGEVRDLIISEYDVDAPQLESDLAKLLNRLIDEGLVRTS